MDEYITISKERYSNLYNQRLKFKKEKSIYILLCFILFVLLVTFFFSSLTEMYRLTSENKKILDDYNYQLSVINTTTLAKADIIEKENEIAQLRDRILFLSFSQAMYEETPIAESVEEEVIEPSTRVNNWSEYVNLFSIGQNVPLPNIDTNTFRCMDYRTITDTHSWQYKIQEKSITEVGTGLRYYLHNGEKYYTVALATAYGIDIGNAYEVELQNGTTFKIIHAEYKHDIRYPSPTDFGDKDKNYDGEETCSVIEFVYDWMNAPDGLISDGEANRWLGEGCDIYGDGCNIVRMTYLGKIWTVN